MSMRSNEDMDMLSWLYAICAIVGGGTLGVFTFVALWFLYVLHQQKRQSAHQASRELPVTPRWVGEIGDILDEYAF